MNKDAFLHNVRIDFNNDLKLVSMRSTVFSRQLRASRLLNIPEELKKLSVLNLKETSHVGFMYNNTVLNILKKYEFLSIYGDLVYKSDKLNLVIKHTNMSSTAPPLRAVPTYFVKPVSPKFLTAIVIQPFVEKIPDLYNNPIWNMANNRFQPKQFGHDFHYGNVGLYKGEFVLHDW